MDLGSSDLVIPSIIHDNPGAAPTEHQYDSSKSATYQPNGTLIGSQPIGQNTSGFLSQDDLQLSDLVIKNMLFEEATITEKESCMFCNQFDTVLPLGPFNASNPRNFMSPIAQLISQTLLDENVFSMLLSRGETDNPGQLVLGGLVDEEFYEGEFITIPTTNLPTPQPAGTPETWIKGDKWKVEAQSLSLGDGSVIDLQFKNSTVAVIDTEYPFIIIPASVAHEINKILDAEFWCPFAWVDCKKRSEMPDITIVLAGQKFVLTAYDYTFEQIDSDESGKLYCMSAFGIGYEEDEGLIFLGTSFLKAWVSVWNLDEMTIGCEYSQMYIENC